MDPNQRTLDDDRVAQLRTTITVAAAADLAESRAASPAPHQGRRIFAGVVAAAVLGLGGVAAVGAFGNGSAGPEPAVAAVTITEDEGWVTVKINDAEATAAEVRDVLVAADLDVQVFKVAGVKPNAYSVPAEEADLVHPVTTMFTFQPGTPEEHTDPEENIRMDDPAEGPVDEVSFRAGSNVSVYLVVEP